MSEAAAIDHQFGAGDIARRVGSQEQHALGDFDRLTADGLLALKWPGSDPTEAALAGLLDGLEDPRPKASS